MAVMIFFFNFNFFFKAIKPTSVLDRCYGFLQLADCCLMISKCLACCTDEHVNLELFWKCCIIGQGGSEPNCWDCQSGWSPDYKICLRFNELFALFPFPNYD